MDRKLGLLLVVGILVSGLFLPAASVAEEVSGVDLIAPDSAGEGVPQVDSCRPEEEAISLEELIQSLGEHKVCGVRCGTYPYVNCSQVCGDAAGCYRGYCIYL